MTPKFCKDCDSYRPRLFKPGQCAQVPRLDTGKPAGDVAKCVNVRLYGPCYASATLFTPRKPGVIRGIWIKLVLWVAKKYIGVP